jgi:AhpC/TSA family
MIRLKLASCMAENSESFCHAVARYIDDQLDVPTDYLTGYSLARAAQRQPSKSRCASRRLSSKWNCGREIRNESWHGRIRNVNLEGKKAPTFSLTGNDGKTHSLDEFKGKTVVLFFYPKDSTPG